MTVNRVYRISDSPQIHIGAVLDCWFVFDWIIWYAPVAPFETTVKVLSVRREAGEMHLEVEPKFTNDGAACAAVLARGATISPGTHRVTAIFDTPVMVRIAPTRVAPLTKKVV